MKFSINSVEGQKIYVTMSMDLEFPDLKTASDFIQRMDNYWRNAKKSSINRKKREEKE